jgi:hypothetical protein
MADLRLHAVASGLGSCLLKTVGAGTGGAEEGCLVRAAEPITRIVLHRCCSDNHQQPCCLLSMQEHVCLFAVLRNCLSLQVKVG